MNPSKSAIITGISGQDGAYLSKYLLNLGYKVIGLVRQNSKTGLYRLNYLNIDHLVEIKVCDLENYDEVSEIMHHYNPDEVYNLAAQSSVGLSFQKPVETFRFNTISVINILETIRKHNKRIKYYQASSSEMFGEMETLPLTEVSKFHPVSPYAISKVAAHQLTINYRESYGLMACCGILFNHESYLRTDSFFVKKVIQGALKIKQGKADTLELGNLNLKRDFGWSEKYIEVMHSMLQHDTADDYLICSGKSIWLHEIVTYVFNKLGVPMSAVVSNDNLIRPNEIHDIYGSASKARNTLNWNYDLSFFEVLDKIIDEEIKNDNDQN